VHGAQLLAIGWCLLHAEMLQPRALCALRSYMNPRDISDRPGGRIWSSRLRRPTFTVPAALSTLAGNCHMQGQVTGNLGTPYLGCWQSSRTDLLGACEAPIWRAVNAVIAVVMLLARCAPPTAAQQNFFFTPNVDDHRGSQACHDDVTSMSLMAIVDPFFCLQQASC